MKRCLLYTTHSVFNPWTDIWIHASTHILIGYMEEDSSTRPWLNHTNQAPHFHCQKHSIFWILSQPGSTKNWDVMLLTYHLNTAASQASIPLHRSQESYDLLPYICTKHISPNLGFVTCRSRLLRLSPNLATNNHLSNSTTPSSKLQQACNNPKPSFSGPDFKTGSSSNNKHSFYTANQWKVIAKCLESVWK